MGSPTYPAIDPITGQALYDHEGKPVVMPYPSSKEEAIRCGFTKWWPGEKCPNHPKLFPHGRFIRSGVNLCCTHENAAQAYNTAEAAGEPTTASDAIYQGKDYYWSPQAFTNCGHSGKNTLKGTCYQCAHDRQHSPRQRAIQAGKTWYQPDVDDPCPHGHVALRRVTNGSCKECEDKRKPVQDVPFHKQFPDMVVSFEDAKTLGMKVYRTGEPCKFGHKGWRYVSTRNCLECMGR